MSQTGGEFQGKPLAFNRAVTAILAHPNNGKYPDIDRGLLEGSPQLILRHPAGDGREIQHRHYELPHSAGRCGLCGAGELLQRRVLRQDARGQGKTLLINHFIINNEWYLVDLPGYGFAKRSKTVQKQLEQMISSYILQRPQLANVFVLIDVRHDQQKIDREFVDWLGESNVPFCIVFTKADKLGPVKARMNAEKWMHALEDRWEALPPYFITSSEKKTGRDEVLDYIDEINKSLAGE